MHIYCVCVVVRTYVCKVIGVENGEVNYVIGIGEVN